MKNYGDKFDFGLIARMNGRQNKSISWASVEARNGQWWI